jgi:beta-lactam-binding protein with PASTA domain
MSYVFSQNVYFVKQQRGTVVVLNAFTPYNPATDVPPHTKPKNFFYDRQVSAYSTITRPFDVPAVIPPPLQTGDIFTGSDTYGWPEPPPPWWSDAPAFFLNFQPVTIYNPNTDVPRFLKRTPWFADALAGMAYQQFIKSQNLPQNWQTSGITLVTVPNVVGQTLAVATGNLALVGLTDAVIGSVYDSVNPIGTVSIQSPIAGVMAVVGSSVQLTLSLGPFVPPPTGITLPEAISIAINADLVVGQPIVWQYDPVIPYNFVISQSPPAGSVIPQQTVVYFVASLGPAPSAPGTITVPDFTGSMILDAQQNAINLGLSRSNSVLYAYSSTVLSGYVVSQSIAAGSVVPFATAIQFTVSVGTSVTTLPGATVVTPTMH